MGLPEGIEGFAFSPAEPTVTSAVLSMFSHVNLLHLLGNLLFLALLGPALETASGWWKFGLVYLLGGLAGVAVFWAVLRGQAFPPALLGASGCVAAAIGFAGVRFARIKLPVLPRLHLSAAAFVLLWAMLQLGGLLLNQPGSTGTAFVTHGAGLVFGFLMSLVLGAPNEGRIESAIQQLQDSGGKSAVASNVLTKRALAENETRPELWKQLAVSHSQMGEREEAGAAWQKVLEHGDFHERSEAILEIEKLGLLAQIDSRKRMRWSSQVAPESRGALLRSIVLNQKDSERPQALLALMEADPTGPWKEQLLADYPLDPTVEIARGKGLL